MLIYMIRHGETTWNKRGCLQGEVDVPLSEEGRRTARLTGEALREVVFDAVLSSPLQRAVETAQLLLAENDAYQKSAPGAPGHPEAKTDERLHEIRWGSWDTLGCRPDNYEVPIPWEEYLKFYTDPLHFAGAPGGESVAQVAERTGAFYRELIAREEWQDDTVLLSTHGCALRGLLREVYEDKEDFWRGYLPGNCAVTIVEVTHGKSRLLAEDELYYEGGENLYPVLLESWK